MPTTNPESVAARDLMDYLFTKPDSYGSKRSPVEEIVRQKVHEVARELADEIIAGIPELRPILRSRMAAMIERLMADDPYVDEHLADAVAKGLRKLAKVDEPFN